jgi:hypothetical protein
MVALSGKMNRHEPIIYFDLEGIVFLFYLLIIERNERQKEMSKLI